eukprot:2330389-Amphidinium_carterae.1
MPVALSATESKPSSDEEFSGFVMSMDAENGEDVYPVFQMDCMSETSDENTYKGSHCRAQLEECPSLLPDSGAVENLVGSNTAKRLAKFSRQQGHQPRWVRLYRPKAISGVGGAASASTHQIIVELNLKGGLKLKYCAPVVSGTSANIPALLGLKEMSRAQMMIHPTQTAAYILPATSSKPQLPPGSITIPLTLSPSGHQLLAVDTARGAFVTTEQLQLQQHQEDEDNNDEDDESEHHYHRQATAASPAPAKGSAPSDHRQATAASPAPATGSTPSDYRQSTAASPAPAIGSTPIERKERDATAALPTIAEDSVEQTDQQLPQQTLLTTTNIPAPRWVPTYAEHKKVIAEVEPIIMAYSPPLAPQRTNVFSEQFQTRSQTLGAYSVRGQGITKATYELMEKHPQLLPAIHRLASTRKENVAYLSIQLTEQQTGLPVHHDAQNESLTNIIALGNFTMGWFYIQQDKSKMAFPADLNPQSQPWKCSRFQIRHKLLEFHPLAYHAVSSPHGRILSVALYSPQSWKKLPNSDIQALPF